MVPWIDTGSAHDPSVSGLSLSEYTASELIYRRCATLRCASAEHIVSAICMLITNWLAVRHGADADTTTIESLG
jgi:hypothetical protein